MSRLPSIPWLPWLIVGCLVLSHGLALRLAANADLPGTVSFLQAGFGLGFLVLPALMARMSSDRLALLLIVLAGLLARATQLDAIALREDDFYRYLLDGMATLRGINPFAASPAEVLAGDGAALGLPALDSQARAVLERVNHPEIRSIYPGTAQVAFALAALVESWSLPAWRVVLLGIDGALLLVLIGLLRELGRAPHWVALYWLNPLVIKEAFNGGHMEPLLALCLLTAIYWTLRGRHMGAMVALALAVGVKVWPVLLLPVLLRFAARSAREAFGRAALFGAVACLVFFPVLLAPFDGGSGFGAYGAYWLNNAPLFDLARYAVAWVSTQLGLSPEPAVLGLRGLAALAVVAVAVALAKKPARDGAALVWGCFWIVIVLFLASPVKLPWYGLWLACFLPLLPRTPMAVLVPCLGLYPLMHVADPLVVHVPRLSWLAWLMVLPLWLAAVLAWCGARHEHG